MKELAHVLYGSQNYCLDGPESDKDYKVLLCPSFDDFYHERKLCADDLPAAYDPDHYSPMSIVKFHELLLKGNPNCLEMVFSTEWSISEVGIGSYIREAKALFSIGYIAIVWHDFYSAARGLALNSLNRGGVNGKTVSRASYILGLCNATIDRGFVVDDSTWRGDTPYKNRARNIRFGQLDLEQLEILADKVKTGFSRYKEPSLNAAASFCESHAVELLACKHRVNTLESMMRRIVARNTYAEIKSEYSFDFTGEC